MNEKEDLFDFDKENEGKALIQVARTKSRVRMITTSAVVALSIIGLGIILKMQVSPMVLNKEVKQEHMYHKVYGANTYLGQWEKYTGLTQSWAKTDTYKIVDGVVVPLEEIRLPKGSKWHENEVVNNRGEIFGVHGQRIMQFYHPAFEYDMTSNDLEKLDEVPQDKVVEVGISFDKRYTVEEVESMLPQGINLQWSWVDIYDENYLQQAFEGIETSPWTENEVVGIHYLDAYGKQIEDPEQAFFDDLDTAIRSGKKYREEFESIKEKIGAEGIGVLGVVVTGSPEVLKALNGQSFVKEASFGAIADRY